MKPILPKDEALDLEGYVRKLWEKMGRPDAEFFMRSKWVRGLCVSESMTTKVQAIADRLARGET